MIISKSIPIACILSTLVLLSVARSSEASSVISSPDDTKEESGSKIGGRRSLKKKKGLNKVEIWASDQSNSVSNQVAAGVNGSYLWIWGSDESSQHPLLDQIKDQDALKLLACSPDKDHGPCDLWDVFPSSLEHGTSAGTTLGQLNGFGRLHGMLKDPQNLYINVNIFAPGGGYVGVINAKTKEAVALFRVTQFKNSNAASGDRSVHMSFWSADGSTIIIDNLNGKAIERIDVTRNKKTGKITNLSFNKSATLSLGKNATVTEAATFFKGPNAFGTPLIGEVIGDYTEEGLKDTTPNGVCKENGCSGGHPDGMAGGRPNNLPICPIPTLNDNAYVTLAGGGLFVIDIKSEPMAIKGEYGKAVVNGAGCGGAEGDNHQVFLNAGISASGAGADQSTFTVYAFDDNGYTSSNAQNHPMPTRVFQDAGNTKTNGNNEGPESNSSGQLAGMTTRRDSHGTVITKNGRYLHVADRLQNVMEVFDTTTYEHVSTYDLVSMDGQSGRSGPTGPCFAHSVLDDGGLTLNDPSPDLMDVTPDGKFIVVGFRGPVPVSVNHSAQGSCPGVGIIELLDDGKSGRLISVLRTTNVFDNSVSSAPGGHPYTGMERSDIHMAIAI